MVHEQLTPEQEQMLDEELLFLQTTQAINMKHNPQPLTKEQFTADLAKHGCYDPLGELYESYLECWYNASKAIYQ